MWTIVLRSLEVVRKMPKDFVDEYEPLLVRGIKEERRLKVCKAYVVITR